MTTVARHVSVRPRHHAGRQHVRRADRRGLRQEVRAAVCGAAVGRRDVPGASLGNHDRPAERVVQALQHGRAALLHRTCAATSGSSRSTARRWIRSSCNGSRRRCRDAKEDWKICYFHHPLYSNADRHGSSVDLRVVLEPIFVKHGVNVVFSGPRPRLRARQAAEGHLLLRVGRGRTAATGQHAARPRTRRRTSIRTRASCWSRSPETRCPIRPISRTGKTVDSGVIHRQGRATAGARASMTGEPTRVATAPVAGAPFPVCRASRVEHLLLLPLGVAIALVWANLGPESLLPVHLCGRVRGQRRRDGVLLRVDDEGGRRGHGARRRAPPVAARACCRLSRRSAPRSCRR